MVRECVGVILGLGTVVVVSSIVGIDYPLFLMALAESSGNKYNIPVITLENDGRKVSYNFRY
jgi:hypothetical protein